MNIVIFAGGVGTRLWPLSRKKSPKQFEKIVGEKSTLQLALDRLAGTFDPKNIYISTNKQYVGYVAEQLENVPKENIIGEPEMRDVGPAVGLATAILAKKAPDTPMAIIWSDHLVKHEELFRKILKTAESLIAENKNKIVFICQKPRFASQNLGWITFGSEVEKRNGISFYSFNGCKYRPDSQTAENYFQSGNHAWNLGYFVTTPRHLLEKYQQYVPAMYEKLLEIQKTWGTHDWNKTLNSIYPTLEKVNFDNAILEKIPQSEGYVVSEDLGWSDVGAWEALKEALQNSSSDTVTRGKVMLEDCRDNLIYNYNNDQMLIAIDVSELVVINTPDVTLVCRKDSVPKIKKLVESFAGTEHEHLT